MSTRGSNGASRERGDGGDARVDALLREVGPLLDVPGDPSLEELARWASAPAVRKRGRWGGVRRLAGAAAVVGLVVGAVYLGLGRGSAAQASTILKAVRGSTFSGLRVTFKSVKANGFELTGEGCVRFAGERSGASLFDGGSKVEVRSMTMRARVVGEEGSEIPGFAGDVILGVKPEQSWARVQSETPGAVVELLGPSGGEAAEVLKQGVLVVFGGEEAEIAVIDMMGSDQVPVIEVIGPDGPMEIQVVEGPGDGPEREGPRLQMLSEKELATHIVPLLREQVEMARLEELARSMGGVSARDAEVEAQADGSSLLTVRAPAGSGASESVEMRVSYRDGSGLQWIEFHGVGESAGSSVRLEVFSGEIAAELLDPARAAEGAVRLDLRGGKK